MALDTIHQALIIQTGEHDLEKLTSLLSKFEPIPFIVYTYAITFGSDPAQLNNLVR